MFECVGLVSACQFGSRRQWRSQMQSGGIDGGPDKGFRIVVEKSIKADIAERVNLVAVS